MPSYSKVDNFIQHELGGNPGIYDAFAGRLYNWLRHMGDPAAEYASFLLQDHKTAMGRGRTKFHIRCLRRGPYAPWQVCTAADARAAITTKVDQLTWDLANDFRDRAVDIISALGTPAEKTAIRSMVMSEIGVLNGVRSMEGLALIDPMEVLARL